MIIPVLYTIPKLLRKYFYKAIVQFETKLFLRVLQTKVDFPAFMCFAINMGNMSRRLCSDPITITFIKN